MEKVSLAPSQVLPTEGILDAIDSADLIVMGAQGTAGLVRRNYKQSVSR